MFEDCRHSTVMVLTEHLRTPFAVLAGAGISYAPPSSLPKAFDVISAVIDALPLDAEARADLKKATSWEWSEGIGYFHLLRFEQIVESLQLSVDPKLEIIRNALPETEPNRYHYFLASLLSRGFPIITTNFDGLIEEACRRSGIGFSVLAAERDYERYLQNPNDFRHPLFKMHGSLARKSGVGGHELGATISEVSTQRMVSPSK